MRVPRRLLTWAAWPGVTALLLAGCASGGGSRPPVTAPAEPGPPVVLERPPVLVVETIVTDRKGAPVTTLRVTDFQVTVDGRRRPGAALARLYRGPGAAALAASVTATSAGETQPVAESARTIVIVVDQPSLGPGDQTRARQIVAACLDSLGIADEVAVVPLPLRRGATIAFERAAVRQAVASIKPLRAAGAEALAIESAEERPGARIDEPPDRDTRPLAGDAAEVSPAILKAHALSSLGGLETVLRSLATSPGAKTVLFVSAGLVTDGARLESAAVAEAAALAQARIFGLQVPTSAVAYRDAGEIDLRALAAETGGSLVRLPEKPEAALEKLAGQLSFSYLLMLAPMPGDSDPVPHAIGVALPQRKDLAVQAPKRVAPGRVTAEAISASLSPRAMAAASPPPIARRPAAPPEPGVATSPNRLSFAHDPDVNPFIARVSEYIAEYGRELSSVVSEETYTQETNAAGNIVLQGVVLDGKTAKAVPVSGGKAARTLVSDYLQVRIPNFQGWLPFRDVFEVDGQRVRDREDRLVKLFVQSSPSRALENAQAIVRESARYNLGSVHRDLNFPTLALWFLEPVSTRRFNFRKVGEETLQGRRVWVVEYTEVVRPTFVKTPAGGNIVSSGRIWAEPTTGRVHRTLLTAGIATITVEYAVRPEVPGLWLPVSMEEQYRSGTVVITGKATYAKFRQFQVQTMEQIQLPKK